MAPETSGPSTTVAKIAIGRRELRVVLHPGPAPKIELRWFEIGGGPAAVFMPTGQGIAFPVEDLGEVLEGLKQAELRFRRDRLEAVNGR